MLIRSQDKNLLINLNTSDGISRDGDGRLVIHHGTINNMIGAYSTKEKAIKVLDMIQNKYLEYYHLKGGPAILKGSIDIAENMWEVPKVFQMPQEREVE